MKDIASHILDITENSVRAGASLVEISVDVDANTYRFSIKDNGCGMTPEQVEQLQNPFYTSRKTRKVGLGIPFLMQNCKMSGGGVSVKSTLGTGTELEAEFGLNHIDRPPEGEMADVFVNIATGYSETDFVFNYTTLKGNFNLDTREVKTMFEGLPINDLDVVLGLKDIVISSLSELK
jgi:hypothetical protein